jgi:glycosyltransferase involved in cell wall biosynthesis
MTTVALGPHIDLHAGVHGALAGCPPPDVRYEVVDTQHVFLFPTPASPRSPHLQAHWGEFVEFPRRDVVAHSARWPVTGHPAWVVDTDDLGIVLLGGRYAMHPRFAEELRGLAAFPDDIRRRADNLLAAYAHPSCRAILCRSRTVAGVTRQWIASLCAGAMAETLLAKLRVLYPAQRPYAEADVRHKWRADAPLRVVFCGRHFESKNGELALRVFGRLSRQFPAVSFVYIGKLPAASRLEHASVLGARVCYLEEPPRERVLAELKASHILFHPSRFESVGIVFFEAAAAGLAVVTAAGGTMAHVGELFSGDGALLVDRERIAAADEGELFEEQLRACLRDPAIARDMAMRNYERSRSGPFSLASRDRALAEAYSEPSTWHGPGLAIDRLPHRQADAVRWSSLEVARDRHAASGIIGPPDHRVLVGAR